MTSTSQSATVRLTRSADPDHTPQCEAPVGTQHATRASANQTPSNIPPVACGPLPAPVTTAVEQGEGECHTSRQDSHDTEDWVQLAETRVAARRLRFVCMKDNTASTTSSIESTFECAVRLETERFWRWCSTQSDARLEPEPSMSSAQRETSCAQQLPEPPNKTHSEMLHQWCATVQPPQGEDPIQATVVAEHIRQHARQSLASLHPENQVQEDVDASHIPFIHPSGEPQKFSEHGKTVPSTQKWLRTAPMPIMSNPPVTSPRPTPAQPVWPAGVPLPFPLQLASSKKKWLLVDRWYREYQTEFRQAVKNGRRNRFCYNKIIGGKHGLVIRNFLSTNYHGIDLSQWQWDLREYWESGGKKPAKPLQYQHAEENSDWKLDLLQKDALAAGFTDKHLLQQLCVEGFSSASSQLSENTIVLCCNYKGASDHNEFVAKDMAKRRTKYKKPRTRGGWHGVPFANCRLHPISVAEQISITGVAKLRMTRDPGASRDPHVLVEPEPQTAGEDIAEPTFVESDEFVSLNGGVDLADPKNHPPAKYATVDAHARAAAVLHASGRKLVQWKSDLSAFFNQLALHTKDVPSNVQFSDPEVGIEEMLRLEFGNSQNPAQAQRTSLLLLFLADKKLRELQSEFITNGKVPKDVLAWMAEREEAGVSTQFYFMSTFIDDTMALALDFFHEAAEAALISVFHLYCVDVADGSWDDFAKEFRKDKFERSEPDGPLECLGVAVSVEGHGGRNLLPQRAELYAASGEALLKQKRVPPKLLQSFLGRVSFASQCVEGVGPMFRQLLSCLPKGWAGVVDDVYGEWQPPRAHLKLTPRAKSSLAELCATVRRNKPTALWPMETPMGSTRPVTWALGDAARNEEAPPSQYVGFGGWIYMPGSDTIYYLHSKWPRPAMLDLDITSLEHFTSTVMMEAVAEVHKMLGRDEPQDIWIAGDNRGASVHVGQSGRATAAPLRSLAAARSARPTHKASDRVVHTHIRRQFNGESDHLSKGKIDDFEREVNERFGRTMQFARLPTQFIRWEVLEEARLIAVEAKATAAAAKAAVEAKAAAHVPHTRAER